MMVRFGSADQDKQEEQHGPIVTSSWVKKNKLQEMFAF
jgi:hypothetical protein